MVQSDASIRMEWLSEQDMAGAADRLSGAVVRKSMECTLVATAAA